MNVVELLWMPSTDEASDDTAKQQQEEEQRKKYKAWHLLQEDSYDVAGTTYMNLASSSVAATQAGAQQQNPPYFAKVLGSKRPVLSSSGNAKEPKAHAAVAVAKGKKRAMVEQEDEDEFQVSILKGWRLLKPSRNAGAELHTTDVAETGEARIGVSASNEFEAANRNALSKVMQGSESASAVEMDLVIPENPSENPNPNPLSGHGAEGSSPALAPQLTPLAPLVPSATLALRPSAIPQETSDPSDQVGIIELDPSSQVIRVQVSGMYAIKMKTVGLGTTEPHVGDTHSRNPNETRPSNFEYLAMAVEDDDNIQYQSISTTLNKQQGFMAYLSTSTRIYFQSVLPIHHPFMLRMELVMRKRKLPKPSWDSDYDDDDDDDGSSIQDPSGSKLLVHPHGSNIKHRKKKQKKSGPHHKKQKQQHLKSGPPVGVGIVGNKVEPSHGMLNVNAGPSNLGAHGNPSGGPLEISTTNTMAYRNNNRQASDSRVKSSRTRRSTMANNNTNTQTRGHGDVRLDPASQTFPASMIHGRTEISGAPGEHTQERAQSYSSHAGSEQASPGNTSAPSYSDTSTSSTTSDSHWEDHFSSDNSTKDLDPQSNRNIRKFIRSCIK